MKLQVNTSTQRQCPKCKNIKPLTREFFHYSKSRAQGFEYVCRECEKIRSKAKYLKNPRPDLYSKMTPEQKQRKLAWARSYGKTDKGKAIFLLKAYETIDKKKGLMCDVDKSFIIESLQKPCTYCGYPSSGLDRKDNSIGHTKENCVPACKECNVGRMDNFSFEEMFIFGEAVRKIKDNRRYHELKIAM